MAILHNVSINIDDAEAKSLAINGGSLKFNSGKSLTLHASTSEQLLLKESSGAEQEVDMQSLSLSDNGLIPGTAWELHNKGSNDVTFTGRFISSRIGTGADVRLVYWRSDAPTWVLLDKDPTLEMTLPSLLAGTTMRLALRRKNSITQSATGYATTCISLNVEGYLTALSFLPDRQREVRMEDKFTVLEGHYWKVSGSGQVKLTLTSPFQNTATTLVALQDGKWVPITTPNAYTIPAVGEVEVALAQRHDVEYTYTFPGVSGTNHVITDGDWTRVAKNRSLTISQEAGFGTYVVTPNLQNQKGAVWRNEPVQLDRDFEMSFDGYFGESDGGADGIAMVWHMDKHCSPSLALRTDALDRGSMGEHMGAFDIKPSLIFEFDTFKNNPDPADDHFGISKNGNATANGHILMPGESFGQNIEDGSWYQLRLSWNSTARIATVTISKSGTTYSRTFTSPALDLQGIFGSERRAIVGFTASTGGSMNTHKFRNLSVSYSSLGIDLDRYRSGLDYEGSLNDSPNPLGNRPAVMANSSKEKVTEVVLSVEAPAAANTIELSHIAPLPAGVSITYSADKRTAWIRGDVSLSAYSDALGLMRARPLKTLSEDCIVKVVAKGVDVENSNKLLEGLPAYAYLRAMRIDLDTSVPGTDYDGDMLASSPISKLSKIVVPEGTKIAKVELTLQQFHSRDELVYGSTTSKGTLSISLPSGNTLAWLAAEVDKVRLTGNTSVNIAREVAVTLVTTDGKRSAPALAKLYASLVFLEVKATETLQNTNYNGPILARDTPIDICTSEAFLKVASGMNITSLEVELLNPKGNERLQATVSSNTVVKLSSSNKLIWESTSGTTKGDFDKVLRGVKYYNMDEVPVLETRQVRVRFFYGPDKSESASSTAFLRVEYPALRIFYGEPGYEQYAYEKILDMNDLKVQTRVLTGDRFFDCWPEAMRKDIHVQDKNVELTEVKDVQFDYTISIADNPFWSRELKYASQSNSLGSMRTDQLHSRLVLNLLAEQLAPNQAGRRAYMEMPRKLKLRVQNAKGDWSNWVTTSVKFINTDNDVLPIELLQWKAVREQEKLSLQWQVSAVQGIVHYELERSSDGIIFDRLERFLHQPGQSRYLHVVGMPMVDTYYRLRLQYAHGAYAYSKPLHVAPKLQGRQLLVYPNPVRGELLQYQYAGKAHESVQLQLIDFSGRVLHTQQLRVSAQGVLQASIPVAKGIYILQLQHAEGSLQQKAIVQ